MAHLLVTLSAALLLVMCLIGGVASGLRVRVRGRAWLGVVALAVLFVAGLWLRLWLLVPHHMMYVDEPWYEEAARNLLHRRGLVLCEQTASGLECRPYTKAVGWPVLLAGMFAVTGPSDAAAFSTSGVLGALCVPLVAIVTLLGGGRWHQALLAAIILAVHPLHALWSATAETNAPTTAFELAGLIGAILYLRAPAWAPALLAAGGLGFAGAMRPELPLAAIPLIVWAIVKRRGRGPQLLVIISAVGVGALSIPLTWGLYESNSGGTFLRAGYIRENISHIVSDPVGGWLTLAIVLMACIGAAVTVRRGALDAATVLGGVGALIGVTVLAYDPRIFYTRNLLGATVAFVPLAALALPRRWPVLGLAAAAGAVLLAGGSWSEVSRVPETQALETALPRQLAAVSLPADALVLAEWPTVVRATVEVPTMATARALGQLEALVSQRPIFLFCDMFCEPGFHGSASACRQVLERFALEPVSTAELHARRYGLYRIHQRRGGETRRAECPFVTPTSGQ